MRNRGADAAARRRAGRPDHGGRQPRAVPGGAAATRDDAPAECRRFFGEEYPAIAGIDDLRSLIDACGYELVAHFALPESAWWDPYYHPLAARLDALEGRYAGDEEAGAVLAMCRREIEMYRPYSAHYGYVFFLVRPRE